MEGVRQIQVEYHSNKWQTLIEMGWMTWTVDEIGR
jgi:hypothetical protein